MPYYNAIVGQSGGPTAAINATLSGILRGAAEAVRSHRLGQIFGMLNGVEGLLADRLTDLTSLSANNGRLRVLEQTPAAALGSCRRRLPDPAEDEEPYRRILEVLASHNIRYFYYIGGNDSMDTVLRLSRYVRARNYALTVVGVPKTIDNDLEGTDHTPGYGSAAKYIATTMQEILRDTAVYTTPAVTVVEIMGRDAGWLTAAAALPRGVNGVGPDLVCLPERPFSTEAFFAAVEKAWQIHPGVVVAVSEGLRTEDGRYVGEGAQSGVTDVFGHRYLAGTGRYLEQALRQRFGCKVRSVELNLPQRCAAHLASATDLSESVRIGRAAVKAGFRKGNGCMMAFSRREGRYAVDVVSRPVEEVANKVRRVPDAFITPDGMNVTDACVQTLLPLIRGERKLVMKDGLPLHLLLH